MIRHVAINGMLPGIVTTPSSMDAATSLGALAELSSLAENAMRMHETMNGLIGKLSDEKAAMEETVQTYAARQAHHTSQNRMLASALMRLSDRQEGTKKALRAMLSEREEISARLREDVVRMLLQNEERDAELRRGIEGLFSDTSRSIAEMQDLVKSLDDEAQIDAKADAFAKPPSPQVEAQAMTPATPVAPVFNYNSVAVERAPSPARPAVHWEGSLPGSPSSTPGAPVFDFNSVAVERAPSPARPAVHWDGSLPGSRSSTPGVNGSALSMHSFTSQSDVPAKPRTPSPPPPAGRVVDDWPDSPPKSAVRLQPSWPWSGSAAPEAPPRESVGLKPGLGWPFQVSSPAPHTPPSPRMAPSPTLPSESDEPARPTFPGRETPFSPSRSSTPSVVFDAGYGAGFGGANGTGSSAASAASAAAPATNGNGPVARPASGKKKSKKSKNKKPT